MPVQYQDRGKESKHPLEITPQMLEAGADAVFELFPEADDYEAAAIKVFEAMTRARLSTR